MPVQSIRHLSKQTKQRLDRAPFTTLRDFIERTQPSSEDCDVLLRCGAFDGFHTSRAQLFWEIQHLLRDHPAATLPALYQGTTKTPRIPLSETSLQQRLQDEMELLGFTVSAHPLRLYDDVDWGSYCRIADLAHHIGETVTCCGLIVEGRTAHQVTGELMKFMTLTDWTGMVETELSAPGYKRYGLATVRYPVLAVKATVEPFENLNGYTLRIHWAGKPRVLKTP